MGAKMEMKGVLSYNKQLWALTCGTLLSVSEEAAQKQLQKAQAQILAGVNHYKCFSDESEKKLQSSLDTKTHQFVANLARQMDLDALQAWDLMVFYLEHEFRGSEDNLASFLESDTKKAQLVKDICTFYWSERAFLLKCIGIYLAFWKNEDHPFHAVYAKLLRDLTPGAILSSLLKQFEQLTEQKPLPSSAFSNSTGGVNSSTVSSSTIKASATGDQWVATNLREQLSVIHNLILFVDGFSINWENVLQILKLCKRTLPFRHRLKRQHLPLLHAITCSQVVLLLRMIDVADLGFAKELWLENGLKTYMEIDAELQELYRKEDHGPLLLAWMLFNFLGPNGEETFAKYRKFGVMASKLGVFAYLDRLLQEPMFKSETTKIADVANATVYNLIDSLAVNFEPEQLQPREQLLSLCSTLLCQPATADRFWTSGADSGLRLIMNVALKRFPLEFEPLVNIVSSLAAASADSCRQVMAMVSELDFLVEPIVPALIPLLQRMPDVNNGVRLNMPHRPLQFVDALLLRPGTMGTLEDGTPHSVRWNFKYSFWLAIHSAEAALLNQIGQSSGAGVEPSVVARALASVRCIAACLDSGIVIESAMVLPIEMVFTIMERFLLVSNPKSAMMAACLDVATCLVSGFPLDVTNKLRALDFLPITHPDEGIVMTHANFARGHFFNAGVLGRLVVNEERPVGSFPLIRAYLRFLHNLIATGCEEKEQQTMALSGLVYVVLEVFPRCYDWSYALPSERTQLSNLCLQLFHLHLNPNALRSGRATDKSKFDLEHLLARTCIYAMLYTDNGHTLLRICATGEAELKARMLQQNSWLSGEGVELVSLVHLALSILNRVLLHKDFVKASKDLSPTEQLIYASPNAKNSLQVVPNIAYYVYHCFNPRLPILAVKLLKRIALEVPMTLRACLAMDGDVIREAFVAKLDSPHQSMQLKVAILELITACIHSQPGATEAFFNIHHPEESRRVFSKDKSPNEEPSGCLTYACSLLSRAKGEPALVRSLLYGAVVELLHALWMHHQKILLNFLRTKSDFWVDLCAPLFLPPSRSVRGYAQVFNILSSEMYTFGTSVHKQLLMQLKKLFSENKYLETWSKFITHSLCIDQNSSKDDSEVVTSQNDSSQDLNDEVVRERLALMTAWKDLLLVILGELRSTAELTLSERQQAILAGHVLEALEKEALRDEGENALHAPRPAALTMLAELLLVLQARWKGACFNNPKSAVSQLHTVLLRVSFVYQDLPPRTRAALLGCGIYAVQLLQNSIRKDEVAMELLAKAAVTMVSHELQSLSISKDGNFSNETSDSLSIAFLQVFCEAVSEKGAGPWQSHIAQSKILAQIIVGLGRVLQSRTHLKFAQSALQLMLALAVCEKSAPLLSLPLLQDHIWLQLTPKEKVLPSNQPFQTPESWVDSPWSTVFCVGVDLVRVILEQQGVRAVEAAVNFSAVQESALLDCLLLAHQTLDPSALALTEATLKFLVQLVRHSTQWRLLAHRTFCTLVRGVSMCLDICVGLLMRPQLLSSLTEGTKQHLQTSLPSDNTEIPIKVTLKLSTVSNKIVNAVILSLAVLRQLSPSVTSLLCDRELDVDAWSPLVEPSFSAPAQPGQRQNMHCLTVGSLLSAINVFTFTAATQAVGGAGSRHAKSPLTMGSRSLRGGASPGRLVSSAVGPSPDPEGGEAAGQGAWLQSLDNDRAQLALQTCLSLLTSQGLLLIRSRDMRDHSLLRRELSTELTHYVELIRRIFGEYSESDHDPQPTSGLATILEECMPRSTSSARSIVARRLLLEEGHSSASSASSTPPSSSPEPAPVQTYIFPCSDSDYLRLMAHIFHKVFRE